MENAQRPADRSTPRPARRAAVVVSVLAGLWLCLSIATVPAGLAGERGSHLFSEPRSRAESLILPMDGKFFADLGGDPTMARLVDSNGGQREVAAYRGSRPVQGWANWLVSLGGQRSLLAPAMLAIGVVALALLPLAVDAVARALGREVRLGELVLAAPATLAFLRWPGVCEPLAAALVLWGLARWLGGHRTAAVALFCVAALTRETTLLVPAGLALATMARTRRLGPALPLLAPVAAYAAWIGVVRLRVGALPLGSDTTGLPFVGLVRSLPAWGVGEVLAAAALVACGVAIWRSGVPVLRWILAVHVAFIACMGQVVWSFWWAFGRVMLPLFLLALIQRPEPAPAVTDEPVDAADALA